MLVSYGSNLSKNLTCDPIHKLEIFRRIPMVEKNVDLTQILLLVIA